MTVSTPLESITLEEELRRLLPQDELAPADQPRAQDDDDDSDDDSDDSSSSSDDDEDSSDSDDDEDN
ncbi:MAG: hypothetical protein NVSMB51_09020 [Solirubrobacteraceae bacterium]